MDAGRFEESEAEEKETNLHLRRPPGSAVASPDAASYFNVTFCGLSPPPPSPPPPTPLCQPLQYPIVSRLGSGRVGSAPLTGSQSSVCRLVQTLSSWESWVISVKDSCAASSLLDNCAHGGVQKQLRTWGSSVLAFPFFYGQYFSLAENIVHCVHGNRKKRLQGFRSRVEQGLLISMQKRSPPCLIRTYKKKRGHCFLFLHQRSLQRKPAEAGDKKTSTSFWLGCVSLDPVLL